jgi:hypothetical protein
MGASGWDHRLNLEGIVAYTGDKPASSYTQFHRKGVLEAVNGRLLAREYQGRPLIPSTAYEQRVFEYLPFCFRLLEEVGCNVPLVVALTLTNTRGLRMGVDDFELGSGYPIQEESLILPETLVHEFKTPVGKILKPMFDLVWNACGYPSSTNFDVDGNWVGRR